MGCPKTEAVRRLHSEYPEWAARLEEKCDLDPDFARRVARVRNMYVLLLSVLPPEKRREWVGKLIDEVMANLVNLGIEVRDSGIVELLSGGSILSLLSKPHLLSKAMEVLRDAGGVLSEIYEKLDAIVPAFLETIKPEYRDIYKRHIRRLAGGEFE